MNSTRDYSLSAKTRLTIILLFTVTAGIIIVSLLVWRTARSALIESTENNLLTINNDRTQQVADFINTIQSQMSTLTEDEMVVNAMVTFNRQFEDLDGQPIPDEWESSIEGYYLNTFFPALQRNIVGELEYEGYRPGGQAASYVQYHYIVTQAAAENRAAVEQADDGSAYSETHLRYHDRFRRLAEAFGYEDLYLIDFETGNVVYSVNKNVDFGTSVITGPYQRSGLGAVVRAIQENPARRSVQIVDYQRYQPLLTAPAGFVGGPIYNGPHVVGILVMQLPTSQINQIMSSNGNWEEINLGSTGESFLIGQDLLMRSDARGFIEDPEAYLAGFSAITVDEQPVVGADAFDTTILLQPINTEAARAALAGRSGVTVQTNAFGEETLTAYAPLNLGGLNWAVLTEQSLDEAFEPIRNMEEQLVIAAVVLIAVSGFLAIVQSNYFMRPVSQTERAMKAERPPEQLQHVARRGDEFGTVARLAMQHMQNQQAQQTHLNALNERYLHLLTSQLPEGVAARFDGSPDNLWDHSAHSTVVAVYIGGMLQNDMSIRRTAEIITQVEKHLHDIAARYDIELFSGGAQSYIAVSGFPVTRPDHIQRAVTFALALLSSLDHLEATLTLPLNAQIGIATGLVTGGTGSDRRFVYNIWGTVAQQAQTLSYQANENSVVVTSDVEKAVHELFEFQQVDEGTWLITDRKSTPDGVAQ